ncbi:hypothetical protein Fmac_004561 [Flemingia macrophylla]|uniref:WAT1-related protein n=1 Tax=Flemingia macrophylla TaxID=520843 RepID=A0ABD1N5Y2_9FABA
MKNCDEWKPFLVMIAIDISLTMVNILLKKVLQEGMNHLVFITYRLSVSTIFLAPIGYFKERLETVNIKFQGGKAKILGTFVCIGGALLLTLYKGKPLFDVSHYQSAVPPEAMRSSAMDQGSSTRKTQKWTIGVIALIMGTLFWSFWFILQSKIGKRYPCRYSSTAIMTFFGAMQAAIIAFSTGSNLSSWVVKDKIQIITVLYSGIVGSSVCYVGMSWCVKKRGPVFTAAFSPLVQIMSGMIDIPILHEQLHLGSVVGSMLVMIGLYILLWGKSKQMVQNGATKFAQEVEESKEQEPQSGVDVLVKQSDWFLAR